MNKFGIWADTYNSKAFVMIYLVLKDNNACDSFQNKEPKQGNFGYD